MMEYELQHWDGFFQEGAEVPLFEDGYTVNDKIQKLIDARVYSQWRYQEGICDFNGLEKYYYPDCLTILEIVSTLLDTSEKLNAYLEDFTKHLQKDLQALNGEEDNIHPIDKVTGTFNSIKEIASKVSVDAENQEKIFGVLLESFQSSFLSGLQKCDKKEDNIDISIHKEVTDTFDSLERHLHQLTVEQIQISIQNLLQEDYDEDNITDIKSDTEDSTESRAEDCHVFLSRLEAAAQSEPNVYHRSFYKKLIANAYQNIDLLFKEQANRFNQLFDHLNQTEFNYYQIKEIIACYKCASGYLRLLTRDATTLEAQKMVEMLLNTNEYQKALNGFVETCIRFFEGYRKTLLLMLDKQYEEVRWMQGPKLSKQEELFQLYSSLVNIFCAIHPDISDLYDQCPSKDTSSSLQDYQNSREHLRRLEALIKSYSTEFQEQQNARINKLREVANSNKLVKQRYLAKFKKSASLRKVVGIKIISRAMEGPLQEEYNYFKELCKQYLPQGNRSFLDEYETHVEGQVPLQFR